MNSCRVCGGAAEPFGQVRLMDRHDVAYFRCATCGAVQTETPYWLEEAYRHAIAASDVGLLRRNLVQATVTGSIVRALFDPHGRFVDYGGGYGVLTRLLRDCGLDFRRHDPMCENLFASGWDAESAGNGGYELLTAFEVFEHLVDPRAEMQRMLAFSRNILFSTLLLPDPPPRPGAWWYYATDSGQHVTLYTRASLERLARAAGLRLVTDGRSLHLFTARDVSPWRFKLLSRYRIARLRFPLVTSRSLTDADYEAAKRRAKA